MGCVWVDVRLKESSYQIAEVLSGAGRQGKEVGGAEVKGATISQPLERLMLKRCEQLERLFSAGRDAVPLVGVHPREMETYPHKGLHLYA